MSTPNFYKQDNFKLYIQSFEPISIEEYEKEYFQDDDYYYELYVDTDDEKLKKYYLEKSYDNEIEIMSQFFYEDIVRGYDGFKEKMEEFNDTLTFHELKFRDGHYVGLQIYVEEKEESPYELDNEDCHYYYDTCRSKAIRKYDSEIKKINKWLDKVASSYGWKELVCLGVFSNGEAIYQYA